MNFVDFITDGFDLYRTFKVRFLLRVLCGVRRFVCLVLEFGLLIGVY